MFTGLIEETGSLKQIKSSAQGAELTISVSSSFLEDVKIGDSISVNGVCQTVVEFGHDFFKTELTNETLSVTVFSDIKVGISLNLEKALLLTERLGGHFVAGHIDCKAKFLGAKVDGFSEILTFNIDESCKKYLIHKGSIAINGVSLTISEVKDSEFSVATIPLTLKHTNLKTLSKGDYVNIEVDMLSKYVEKFLLLKNNSATIIDENLLKENGFL
ncbi:MAG: riboflavin synthase [Candidatus Gastranaerophilales bacterium]|nr:riboflavin synthase [Candidatus Gastranaerophilales bacterium]